MVQWMFITQVLWHTFDFSVFDVALGREHPAWIESHHLQSYGQHFANTKYEVAERCGLGSVNEQILYCLVCVLIVSDFLLCMVGGEGEISMCTSHIF